MAGSSAAGGGRPHGPTALNAISNVANQPSAAANGSPVGGRVGGHQGGRPSHSSHVAQAAAGALSSDISRRNPQDDYALLQVYLVACMVIVIHTTYKSKVRLFKVL